MTIVLDGTSGITAPTYGGTVASEYHVPVTAYKNRIINGNMAIDQRNAGASVTASGAYTLDRWLAYQSAGSKYSVQQNAGAVTPPVGFSNYLGTTSLSAYSILTSDYFGIRQYIEGFNFADMNWGTANASAITLSFWVRSSLTGTFGGSLGNSAQTRSYPFTYTILSANTWTNISISITGDTTGTWLGATNGTGVQLNFGLGVGATYSATAGSWSGGNYFSATGAVSVVGTSGATFYITGVQLEKGSVATSFDQRAYSQELAMCQRYYEKSFPIETVPAIITTAGQLGREIRVTYGDGAGNHSFSSVFQVVKRAPPTIVFYSNANVGNIQVYVGSYTGGAGAATLNSSTHGFDAYAFSYTTNATSACFYQWTASAEL